MQISNEENKRRNLPLPKRSHEQGKVLVCGQGELGQLGLGVDTLECQSPTILAHIKDAVDVKAGTMHSMVLTVDGNVYTFGCNDDGALGFPDANEELSYLPRQVSLPAKAVKIVAGDSHSACLLEDGRVFAWGSFRDSNGPIGLTMSGIRYTPEDINPGEKYCDISSGALHLVLLTSRGRVYTVGCGEFGQLGRISSRCLKTGFRRYKERMIVTGLCTIKNHKTRIEAIWATSYCTFMREVGSNEVWGCGLNHRGQLGVLTSEPLILRPILTPFKNVKELAGGQEHIILLCTDNSCYAVGCTSYGRLGLGKLRYSTTTLKEIIPLGGQNISTVTCGERQTFALTESGNLYAFGMGSNWQLGTDHDEDVVEPQLAKGGYLKNRRILSVSIGAQHSIFLVDINETPSKAKMLENLSETSEITGRENKESACSISKSCTSVPIQNTRLVKAASTSDVIDSKNATVDNKFQAKSSHQDIGQN